MKKGLIQPGASEKGLVPEVALGSGGQNIRRAGTNFAGVGGVEEALDCRGEGNVQ